MDDATLLEVLHATATAIADALGDLDDWASVLWRQWIALRPVRAAVPAARLPEALDEDGNEGATQ